MNVNKSFKDAIEKGIRNGMKGSDERKRIRAVVQTFGQELSVGIKAAMEVETTVQFHEPTANPQPTGAKAEKEPEGPGAEESPSLSVCVKGGSIWFELLRLDMHAMTGFPCAVAYEERRYPCSNEMELRAQLKRLVQERGTYIVENVTKHTKKSQWQRLVL